jgi:hypothetical protein
MSMQIKRKNFTKLLTLVHEYKGLATTAPLDKSATSIGNSANSASASVTTTQNSELVFGAIAVDDGSDPVINQVPDLPNDNPLRTQRPRILYKARPDLQQLHLA